eukprot:1158103-Pelagomonas_calceolata.AAC.7
MPGAYPEQREVVGSFALDLSDPFGLLEASKLPPPLSTLPTCAAKEAALKRSLRQARVLFHPDKVSERARAQGLFGRLSYGTQIA